jgi:hypothetical protein
VTGITTLAIGAADGPDPAAFARNGPSFFADPAAWLVTAAVADALDACPENVLARPDAAGVIVVTQRCTAVTLQAIARTAGRGMVSPLRFAGANPGILAGLPCITYQLRGPSLVLATDPATGVPAAAAVAASWLSLRQAAYVLVAVHLAREGQHAARCAVVRTPRPGEPSERLDALLPDALLPDALLPDALLPDALLPDALLPDALLPDAFPPEARRRA